MHTFLPGETQCGEVLPIWSIGKETRVRKIKMSVSEYSFSKHLGKVEHPRKPHHKMGTAATSSSPGAAQLAAPFSCYSCGVLGQVTLISTQNFHYTTSITLWPPAPAGSFFALVKPLLLMSRERAGKWTVSIIVQLKGNGKQHRISHFIGCIEVLAFNNFFLRLFI